MEIAQLKVLQMLRLANNQLTGEGPIDFFACRRTIVAFGRAVRVFEPGVANPLPVAINTVDTDERGNRCQDWGSRGQRTKRKTRQKQLHGWSVRETCRGVIAAARLP